MSGLIKKVLAALAIKEGIEKIQEMRRPKPSLASRLTRPSLLVALAGGAMYLQQTGKLGPLVQKAKGLTGSSGSLSNSAPSGSNGSSPVTSTSTTSTSV